MAAAPDDHRVLAHAKTLAVFSGLMPRAASNASSLDLQGLAEESDHTDDADALGGWLAEHVQVVGTPEPLVGATDGSSPEAKARRERALQQVQRLATQYSQDDSSVYQRSRKYSSLSSPVLDVVKGQSDPMLMPVKRPAAPTRQADETRCCRCADILDALRRCCCGGAEASKGAPLAFDCKDSAVVIFDWDDTLFPTTFLTKTLIPSLPPDCQASVPVDSPYYDALKHHGHLLQFVLHAARKVARVAIVTLSMSPWVEASSRYLPGLDITALLQELDIPVYYSREHVHNEVKTWIAKLDRSAVAGNRVGMDVDVIDRGALLIRHIAAGGAADQWNQDHPDEKLQPGDCVVSVNGHSDGLVNLCRTERSLSLKVLRQNNDPNAYIAAKAKDMSSCLRRFYAGPARHRNVVSVGDSLTEKEALKSLLLPSVEGGAECPATDGERAALCKTVNLLDGPSLEQLANELRVLMVWLPRIVAKSRNFDLTMDALDDLERDLFNL